MSDRIEAQLKNLDDYAIERYKIEKSERQITRNNPVQLTLDVMGFSRGAAEARDFANQLLTRRDSGYFRKLNGINGGCITLDIRFMGLFDTVLAANGPVRRGFNLSISTSVQYVAHAVAVNEHRSKFMLDTIGGSRTNNNGTRIERGFVGAHADIGGGYNGSAGGDGGDLSDVALNWMYDQAFNAGVRMNSLSNAQRTVTNPIIHNERVTSPFCATIGGGGMPNQERQVRAPNGSLTPQATAIIDGLNTANSQQFINWTPNQQTSPSCLLRQSNKAGTVDMNKYKQWLNTNYQVSLQ